MVSLTDADQRERGAAPAKPLVEHLSFSFDGSVMVTVDSRADAGLHLSSAPANSDAVATRQLPKQSVIHYIPGGLCSLPRRYFMCTHQTWGSHGC